VKLRVSRRRLPTDDQRQCSLLERCIRFPPPLHPSDASVVDRVAKAHNVTGAQVALAWLLRHNPVMLPIPGTLRVTHLKENVAAAGLSLTPEEMDLLDSALE
jgi:aryl-alcohol dehydrogenase-like predicted oxidoreductase